MEGVLLGFSVVLVIVVIGLMTAVLLPGRAPAMQNGLTSVVYYITNPALMVVLVSETDLGQVAGVYTPIALISAALAGVVYSLVSVVGLRRSAERTALGAMASSYVNAANIGLPIALYAVGSATPVVAVLLAQLLVVAPIYLGIFAWCTRRAGPGGGEASPSLGRTLVRTIANPVTVGTAAGVVLSLTGWRPPEAIWTPIDMIGAASVPLLLLLFGMSMHGQRPFKQRHLRPDIVWASAVKLLVMPVAAWAVARFGFGVSGGALLGVVTMAALPTAQNVFLFASQFKMPLVLARDVVFFTSILALPTVVLVASFLS